MLHLYGSFLQVRSFTSVEGSLFKYRLLDVPIDSCNFESCTTAQNLSRLPNATMANTQHYPQFGNEIWNEILLLGYYLHFYSIFGYGLHGLLAEHYFYRLESSSDSIAKSIILIHECIERVNFLYQHYKKQVLTIISSSWRQKKGWERRCYVHQPGI